MKRLACTILLLIIASVFTLAYDYNWKPQDTSIAKEYPGYLLVIRYWGGVSVQYGDSMTSEQGWVYLYEPYDNMDAVITRLNTYTGFGMDTEERETNLVGLWRLGEENNIADTALKLDEIKYAAKKVIEKEEWTEYRWSH